MNNNISISDFEDVVILSITPHIDNSKISPGYYEYEFEVLSAPHSVQQYITFEVNVIKNKKICVVTSILSRTILSDNYEKVIFVAASPLYYLKDEYIERSWVNKSIYEVLSNVLSPILVRKGYGLKGCNNLIIKFLYQDNSCSSLEFLCKILNKNSISLCTLLTKDNMFFYLEPYRLRGKDIKDLSPIQLYSKSSISAAFAGVEEYTNRYWRIYDHSEYGSGINKILKVVTEHLSVQVGDIYSYGGERYIVTNALFCFRNFLSYDLVLILILSYTDNQYNYIHDLKSACLGFAVSKKIYRNGNVSYASYLLNNSSDLPIPITEIMTARLGEKLLLLHTYKENSNMFLVRMYNTNKLIALPGAYDLDNATALTTENDVITQSDAGKVLASNDGITFQVGKVFNKLNNNWEVEADSIYYKAEEVTESNISRKCINSSDEVDINISDYISVSSKSTQYISTRQNSNYGTLNVKTNDLDYCSDESIVKGEELLLAAGQVFLDGEELCAEGQNIKILADNILLSTPGASINMSHGVISMNASLIILGSGKVLYNGKVLRN